MAFWRSPCTQGSHASLMFPHFETYILPLQTFRIKFNMSRTLDKETIKSLQSDDLQVIYKDIVSALCPDTPELLEIELLGKSHPLPAGINVLSEENSIAIPKVRLVQAFVVARQMFFKLVRSCPEEKRQDLRNASAVILLMDPEHLTAANARKRLIQSYQEELEAELEAMLERELVFVDSYLTSRLHRHTKSPTLWGHRRWLLELYRFAYMKHDIVQDLKTAVLFAAERHPRNYYAWSHMRWLVQSFGDTNPEILSLVKDWCLKHPADTSGFSFLLFYLSISVSPGHAPRIEVSTTLCKEVLDLAVSFKWTHESVWVFLRTLVASGDVTKDQKTSFLKSIDAILETDPENSKTQAILKGAREWYEKYEQRPHSRSR
jgi:protein prenyltransferase alpha subunit repeat containing protein 1